MTGLQFSLFFAAVVIGAVIVLVRIARTEQLLRELRRLSGIEERLQSIESTVRGVGTSSEIGDVLAAIRDDLAATLARLDRPVTVLEPQARPVDVVDQGPGELLRDRIEARLYSMGYQQVRILTDLKGVDLLDTCKVTIECQRDEIGHKGTVTVQNGSVLELRLLPILQVFP